MKLIICCCIRYSLMIHISSLYAIPRGGEVSRKTFLLWIIKLLIVATLLLGGIVLIFVVVCVDGEW